MVHLVLQDKINLSGLWPIFSSIGETPLSSEQLSALFVLALLIVFTLFVLLSVVALFRSLRQTSWLINMIKGETSSTVLSKRHEIIEKTVNIKYSAGHLWRELMKR